MKIQKIHLLVVFLLLIVFSVYVLRPSIYPLSYYEYLENKLDDNQIKNIEDALTCNPKKNKVCAQLKGAGSGDALQAHLNYMRELEIENAELQEAAISNDSVNVSTTEDTSAKIGLLQTQINLQDQNLTKRFNQSINRQIRRVDGKINAALVAIDELLDEDGNILVDKIQNTDLGNKIKEVVAQDRGPELLKLRTDIDENIKTIDSNKTQQSSALSTLRESINNKINEYRNTNAAELSNIGKEIDDTNNSIQAANSDIASVQAELEGVDLEQLTYYVGNNIVDIADISITIATIIPYTEFRDDLRDTYREQYLQHLETEH